MEAKNGKKSEEEEEHGTRNTESYSYRRGYPAHTPSQYFDGQIKFIII